MRNTFALLLVLAFGCVADVGGVSEEPDDELIASDIDDELTEVLPEIGPEGEAGVEIIASTTNLIVNGGFETGVGKTASNWRVTAGRATAGDVVISDYVFRTAEAPFVGSYGLRLRSPTGQASFAMAYKYVSVTSGRSYSFSAKARKRSGDFQRVHLQFVGPEGAVISQRTLNAPDNNLWSTLTATLLAPTGATRLLVTLGDTGLPLFASSYDWDRVRLVAN